MAGGNCADIALAADDAPQDCRISAEVIDRRFSVSCDLSSISRSVRKTGLMVVQEDDRTCSFEQSLIANMVSEPHVWTKLEKPPRLISRDDVHIGFHSQLEAAMLPQKSHVVEGIHESDGNRGPSGRTALTHLPRQALCIAFTVLPARVDNSVVGFQPPSASPWRGR